MIYAPVIIPTLNRFEHLKQCVESLNNCHHAEKTEVYISVDYPPSEDYKEGHNKICDYLDKNKFKFKELHVIKQNENLGVDLNGANKISNSMFLKQLVMKKYDRWIASEDDNVFAPGFLDFMNECLERFENDDTVFSVCGYSFYYNLKFADNNFFRQHSDFNAWGCGFWREKYRVIMQLDVRYLKKVFYNPFKALRIWRVSNMQLDHLASFSCKEIFKKGDNFLTLYMIDHGMTQIMPAKSLVRNIGWDESGLHCVGFEKDVVEKHLNQEIDDSPSFKGLKGTGWEFFKDNERVIRAEDFQRISFWKALYVYLRRFMYFRK